MAASRAATSPPSGLIQIRHAACRRRGRAALERPGPLLPQMLPLDKIASRRFCKMAGFIGFLEPTAPAARLDPSGWPKGFSPDR
jgi:hypothetical protein